MAAIGGIFCVEGLREHLQDAPAPPPPLPPQPVPGGKVAVAVGVSIIGLLILFIIGCFFYNAATGGNG